MVVFSLSAVSADDFQSTDSGQVSGDVDVVSVNPGTTSGELTYAIPSDANIQKADVYVNVYSGSAKNTHGANANVSLKTDNGENQIASEKLWIEDGSTDGTIYKVNDHINKCYSDYQMYYDITDAVKGLNGTSVAIKVDTFKLDNYSFDGRIKLIALIVAYDDGDQDVVNYYIDSSQRWTKTNVTTVFNTKDLTSVYNAELINIALSSTDGTYQLNGEYLGDALNHTTGGGFYYQYNLWNATEKMQAGNDTEFVSYSGTGTYSSLKNVLTVLKANTMKVDVSFATEYTSVNTCYAGTNNTITVNVNSNYAGKYKIQLLADGTVAAESEIDLDGENSSKVLLTDDKIRPIDETTVNGANNTEVVYAVNVLFNDNIVGSANKTVPVLYNGNLGYDMEYNLTGFESYADIVIAGDIVIDVKDVGTYLASKAMNRTDVWTVNLDKNDKLNDALLFIAYNWFNSKSYTENAEMFNLTFNGKSIAPVAYYRDQSNLGGYGGYGYGVFVYNVCELLNTSGDNTLELTKKYATPAVYPSALVYMYETKGATLKEISIVLGADLLANSANNAGRPVKSDSVIDITNAGYENATLYVLAAGAQKGESNIIVNGKQFADVWSGTSSTTDLFTADISDILKPSNNISFVATGSTILALPQIIVADSGISLSIDSVKTEYTSVLTAYAGTNNTLTVDFSNDKSGEYHFDLYADGVLVDSIKVNLTNGTNTVSLTDPTIRPVDETTVNGANNTKVEYTVCATYESVTVNSTITVPVLYNGNLGKDMEYNATYIEDTSVIEVNGGVVIDVKDDSTYMGAGVTSREDVWNIVLDDDSSLVNAYVYIAYNWDKSGVAGPVFNVTFNGKTLTPKAHYRDQSNLGKYGAYGYGLFVYDVSDLAKKGENNLTLNKPNGLTAVYPSNLIYFYNTTASNVITKVFLADGADLMSNANNNAGRIAKTDSQIDVASSKLYDTKKAYVFAAGAQKGEGNIIINDNEFENVWSGSSNSFDVFVCDKDGVIGDSNTISFVATGSTILALNQMIVTTYKQTEAKFDDMIVCGNGTLGASLVDIKGNPIANAEIIYKINGVENTASTNDKGEFSILAGSSALVEIIFEGNDFYFPLNTSITLKDIVPTRTATVIEGNNFTQYAIDYYAGERGGNFTVQLKDASGKVLANKVVLIGYNGKCLERITDENGYASVTINLLAANRLTFAVAFLGDENYDASMSVYLITINKKPVTISAPAKTFKASAKTKSYTVTLSTIKGVDGKTYFGAGKKVTLSVNGKTYSAKTNAKGQATFKLTITKKGTYTATVNYAGDNTYNSAKATAKIKIN